MSSPSCIAAYNAQCLYLSSHSLRSHHKHLHSRQAYHSVFLDEPNQHLIGNFALLPLRTRTRGPALQLPALPAGESDFDIDASHESYDPLDEVLSLFRANTFFRNFEIKGPADRVLIYGILFVQEILGKVKASTPIPMSLHFIHVSILTEGLLDMTRRDAEKAINNVTLDPNFAIPGDAGFPLNQQFEGARDRHEAETLRQYMMQMRQELGARLVGRLYMDGTDRPSKWWLSFTKRKFMGKGL